MMPTIIFFDKDGKEFYRIEGNINKKLIEDKISIFAGVTKKVILD